MTVEYVTAEEFRRALADGRRAPRAARARVSRRSSSNPGERLSSLDRAARLGWAVLHYDGTAWWLATCAHDRETGRYDSYDMLCDAVQRGEIT